MLFSYQGCLIILLFEHQIVRRFFKIMFSTKSLRNALSMLNNLNSDQDRPFCAGPDLYPNRLQKLKADVTIRPLRRLIVQHMRTQAKAVRPKIVVTAEFSDILYLQVTLKTGILGYHSALSFSPSLHCKKYASVSTKRGGSLAANQLPPGWC